MFYRPARIHVLTAMVRRKAAFGTLCPGVRIRKQAGRGETEDVARAHRGWTSWLPPAVKGEELGLHCPHIDAAVAGSAKMLKLAQLAGKILGAA